MWRYPHVASNNISRQFPRPGGGLDLVRKIDQIMSLTSKPFDFLNESDLIEHVTEAIPEGRTLDYKLELPGGSNDEKLEFLADMSSFANASGGHVVYGIEEAGGAATALPGISGIDPDAQLLRLEGMVQSSVDPRIPGVTFRAVHLGNGNVAVVAFIPKSPAAPHMITFQGRQLFYSRNSAGKYKMDVGELARAATA